MPGKHSEELCIQLPENMENGEYDIAITIDSDIVGQVYFATDAPSDGRWYTLGHLEVK